MSDVVLDASAILALLREEPGGDAVAAHVGRAAISAVNLQEVVKELLRQGATVEAARPVLDELGLALHPHNEAAAYAAAAFYSATKRHRRGLGDRSCLALGLALDLPVLTADREWRHVEVEGLKIELVR